MIAKADLPATLLVLVWIAVSLRIVVQLWTKHKRDAMLRKCLWTVVACVPLFGWLLYGASYDGASRNEGSGSDGTSGWTPQYRWGGMFRKANVLKPPHKKDPGD